MKNDIFAKAKRVKSEKADPKNNKKTEYPITGMREYASIDALEKSLKAMKEAALMTVTTQVVDIFVNEITAHHKRPENFRGVEGDAWASCELKKRQRTSVLSDEEVQALESHGIPYEVVPDRPEGYMFNPAVLTPPVMEKLIKALSGVKGLPDDLLIFNEATKRRIATEDTIDAICKKPPEVVRELLPMATTISLKAVVEHADQVISGVLQGLVDTKKKAVA